MSVMAWAVSLPALVFLLLALGVLERVYRRARRTRGKGLPVSGVAFDEFTAFLFGTKRYELDQRATQSLMREEEGDGAPPNTVDLANNRVVMDMRDSKK
jgi:hypothetical protein